MNLGFIKSKDNLLKILLQVLSFAYHLQQKSNRWEKAVKKLESDFNFRDESL